MPIERTKYEKLFSTPVLRFRVPDHADLNAALLSELAALRSASDGVDKSNRGGWHSAGNIFDHDAPAIMNVRAHATEAVLDANDRIGARADAAGLRLKLFGWMNANPTGGFNAPHSHPGAHWSGVYYIKQPGVESGNSGMIEFIAPRADLSHWRILDAPPFRLKKKIRPEEGELILFPSYLVHWVYPNDTAEERVTLAFNATFSRRKDIHRDA